MRNEHYGLYCEGPMWRQMVESTVLKIDRHSDGDGDLGQAYGAYCIYLEYSMKHDPGNPLS